MDRHGNLDPRELRLEAIYLWCEAVSALSTKAVRDWASARLGSVFNGRVEWIDDVTVVLVFRSPALALAAFDVLLLKPSPELHAAFEDVESHGVRDAETEADLLEVLTVSRLAHAFPESALPETADEEVRTIDARTPEIRPATLSDVKVRGIAVRVR